MATTTLHSVLWSDNQRKFQERKWGEEIRGQASLARELLRVGKERTREEVTFPFYSLK